MKINTNMMILFIAFLLPIFIFALIGFLIKYKKAYWLISGYNTMSEEKKKNVDIESIGKLMSGMCFLVAAIMLVALVFILLGKPAISGLLSALILPVIVYTVIKAQKYDGNTRNSDGKMKKRTKALISTIIAAAILIIAGVGALFYYSNKPAEYILQNGTLNISGLYGQKIEVNTINNLDLKESIPEIQYKSNGSALGNMLKGYFILEDMGKAKLFIDSSKPPFIYLETDSNIYILNSDSREKTIELYEKLNAVYKK